MHQYFGADGPHVTHLLFADDSIVFLEASRQNMQTLKRVLTDYEVSSGQRVNLQKSSIFFGPGCNDGLKEQVKRDIGIACEALSERYLGLPTVVGKSKAGCFQYLTDRSWGKIKGWKGQGMSKAGRGTFIKSVLQAVPAYAMSCFQLTKNQCKKLGMVSANLWWGDAEGKKKVHWISWKRMCQSKSNWGVGFRDFECFNQAFLSKQGWRLLTDKDSLCAKVLKARYHKSTDFLQATCPKRASFMWRSIIHGRDLLKAGLIWRIGDGESVKVWEDNWIPRSSLQRPLAWLREQPPEMVSEFLDEYGRGWDEGKLRLFLPEQDVEDIMGIQLGSAGASDFQAWNYTK
jgi:hypothetical protein